MKNIPMSMFVQYLIFFMVIDIIFFAFGAWTPMMSLESLLMAALIAVGAGAGIARYKREAQS